MNILTYIRQDPAISFGRPTIAGTGVTCVVLFDRYEAGESMETLARDYNIDFAAVYEAIVFEAGRRFVWRKRLPTRGVLHN